MQYTIHLPCYPYVKKYLEAKYQFPLLIKKSNKLGKYIYLALERMPIKCDKYPVLGAQLPLLISEDFYQKKGLYISKESIYLINDLIFDELFDEIFNYLYNAHNNLGIKRYDAIKITYQIKRDHKEKAIYKRIKRPELMHFIEVRNVIEEILNKYGLNFEDISYESIHRAYYRAKDKYKLLIAS